MANLDKNPQNGLQGTSYLYQMGTSANTRTAVSQKVRVLAPAYGNNQALHQMGVISSFAPDETKNVEPVRGIGFGDHVAELVPSVTEPMTANFERSLLYLCNLWQATGYAAGVDGPVRSLKHHKWPFDVEQQLVFSSLADIDLTGQGGVGFEGQSGTFDGGVKAVEFPQVTNDRNSNPGANRGHTTIITIYEACWFTSWGVSYGAGEGALMENGGVTITDIHDFSSVYGEFLASGNDPTLGQLGSIRYAETLNALNSDQGLRFSVTPPGGGTFGSGGGTQILNQ